MFSSRVFQTRGPSTVKARLPTVESPTNGSDTGQQTIGTIFVVRAEFYNNQLLHSDNSSTKDKMYIALSHHSMANQF